MKRFPLTLCLTFTSVGLVLADHHGGDDLGKKLDALLAGIAQDDEVQRYEPRMAVRDLTSAASAPGSKTREAYVKLLLDRYAKDETHQAAKAWILRQLENVGRAESVPALKKTMGSPFHHLRELARRALEQNPSEEAGAALRDLADSEKDRRTKRALIHTLGARGDAKAVSMIAKLIDSKDQALRSTAIEALGKIASEESTKVLSKAHDGASGGARLAIADALLESARRLSAHHADKAAPILKSLYESEQPAEVQAAAFRGLVSLNPAKADDLILLALQSEEGTIRQAAITACRDLEGPSVLPNVLAVKLPDLEATEQAMALAVLADSGDATVAAQLADTLGESKSTPEQSLAMIGVLEKLGGVDASARLLDLAARAEEDSVQDAAREALANLPGASVDAALSAASQTGDIESRASAIAALGARGSLSALPTLFAHADAGPKAIRQASLEALGNLVTSEEMPRLIAYLPKDDGAALKAVVQACRRVQDKDKAADAVLSGMEPLSIEQKEKLLPALGVLGGEKAFGTVKSLLEDKALGKTAMKTLTRWSGPEAGPVFLELAQKEGTSPTDQTLLLRGLGRLIDKGDGINGEARLDWTLKGMKAAKRSADKKLFLPVLAKLGSEESMKALIGLMADKEVGAEASQAALNAAKSMRGGRRSGRAKQRLLKEIVRGASDKEVVSEAQKMLDKLD